MLSWRQFKVKENGITYLSGGFDPEEALAMQAEARSYPLRLVFSAGERAESLADVKVTIEDTAGKALLDAVSTGPIMLVRLPAGRYTIRAVKSSPDIGLQLSVQVTAQSAERLDFHLQPQDVPVAWVRLREEARPMFAEMNIWKAELVRLARS